MKLEIANEKLIKLLDQEEWNTEFFDTMTSTQYVFLASAYQLPLRKRADLQILMKPPTVPILSANINAKIDALTEQIQMLFINQQQFMNTQA